MRPPMDPERWARIREAFFYGIALDPDRAREGLRTFCGGDDGLLAEVVRLVEEHFRLVAQDLNRRAVLPPPIESEPEFAGGRFRVISRLGSGTFGDVYHIVDGPRG